MTALEAARAELSWFKLVRDVWPAAVPDSYQRLLPDELVVPALVAHCRAYRDGLLKARAEATAAQRLVRDLLSAAQAVVAAVPAQGELL